MQAKSEISVIVRAILREGGMTQGQLAGAIGVDETRIKSLVNGRVKKLHPDEVIALVKILRVRMAFLDSGEGDVFEPERRAPEVPVAPADIPESYTRPPKATRLDLEAFVTVPRYDVSACAGHGAVIHSEQIVDYLAFRADWVHNALGVSSKDLALISVKGDSMEPTLSNGDLILLDMHQGKIEDNAIYALQHNATLVVKRVQRKLDGSVVVKSDNPLYEAEALGADAAALLKVVGRVVWAGRRM